MNKKASSMMKLSPRKWTAEMWDIATKMAAFLLAAFVAKQKGEL